MKSSAKSLNLILTGMLAVAVILVILIVVGGWYYIMGKSATLAKTRTESVYLDQQQNVLSNLEIDYQKVLPDKALIEDSVPTDKDVSTFLADVNNIAAADGMSITETDVGAQVVTSADGTVSAGNPAFSQMKSVGGYYELPVVVTFHGNYANFTKAVASLYNLRRVNNITEIDLNRSSADGSDTTDLVDAKVSLSIYVKP